MEMFQYSFMIKALIVGLMLGIVVPIVGHVIVLKRLSMIGDALGHASLAGVSIGVLLGFNPIFGALVMAVICALGIDYLSSNIKRYKEMSIVIVMSLAIGIAAILSSMITNPSSFNAFLFGSIVTITNEEVFITLIISLFVTISYYIFRLDLMYLCFDEELSTLAGVRTKRVNFIFTIISALSIAIASRVIGVLIVSSLLVIPVACALQISKSYRMTIINGILFGVFFVISGIVLSYYFSVTPGGAIVLISVLVYLILLITSKNKVYS